MLEYCDPVTVALLDPSAPRYRWRTIVDNISVVNQTLHYNDFPRKRWPGVRAVRAYAGRRRPHRVLMVTGEQGICVDRWRPPCPIPKEDYWALDSFLTLIDDGTAVF